MIVVSHLMFRLFAISEKTNALSLAAAALSSANSHFGKDIGDIGDDKNNINTNNTAAGDGKGKDVINSDPSSNNSNNKPQKKENSKERVNRNKNKMEMNKRQSQIVMTQMIRMSVMLRVSGE